MINQFPYFFSFTPSLTTIKALSCSFESLGLLFQVVKLNLARLLFYLLLFQFFSLISYSFSCFSSSSFLTSFSWELLLTAIVENEILVILVEGLAGKFNANPAKLRQIIPSLAHLNF